MKSLLFLPLLITACASTQRLEDEVKSLRSDLKYVQMVSSNTLQGMCATSYTLCMEDIEICHERTKTCLQMAEQIFINPEFREALEKADAEK